MQYLGFRDVPKSCKTNVITENWLDLKKEISESIRFQLVEQIHQRESFHTVSLKVINGLFQNL